jgi:hypothetical protein
MASNLGAYGASSVEAEARASQTGPVLRALCQDASSTLIRHRGFMRV